MLECLWLFSARTILSTLASWRGNRGGGGGSDSGQVGLLGSRGPVVRTKSDGCSREFSGTCFGFFQNDHSSCHTRSAVRRQGCIWGLGLKVWVICQPTNQFLPASAVAAKPRASRLFERQAHFPQEDGQASVAQRQHKISHDRADCCLQPPD